MTLMRIRDDNFSLLLNKGPGAASAFPLVSLWTSSRITARIADTYPPPVFLQVYAMRCGEKWGETVIVLVGALSRVSPHSRHIATVAPWN